VTYDFSWNDVEDETADENAAVATDENKEAE